MGIIKTNDVLSWLVCSWWEMCSCSSVRSYNAVLGRCLRSLSRNAVAYSAVHPAWWNFRWTLYRSLFLVFPRFRVCERLRTQSSFWRNRVLSADLRIAYFRVRKLLFARNLRYGECSIMNGQYGDGRVQCWCCSHWSSSVEADSSDAMLPAWFSQWRRFFYTHTTHKSPPYGVLR